MRARRRRAKLLTVLLVCGATGLLGGLIAAKLAERGAAFRALVRPSADAAPIASLGAEIVRGDFRRPATLAPAAEGVDTVVSGVTAIGRMLAGGDRRDGLTRVDRDGHLALIDAAEAGGASRFVFVSAAGLERLPGMPLARAKLAVEERLRASRLREVVLRPDAFQEVWLSPASGLDWEQGRLTVYGRGEARARYLAVEDVAEAAVRWALDPDPPRSIDFGGPEALSRNEVAALVEEAAGRPLKRRRIPRAALSAGYRPLAPLKPEVATVMALSLLLDREDVPWDDAPLRALGMDPRPASAYIRLSVGAG